MPTRERWADQVDDSDYEMSVDIPGGAPKSGASRRNRSTDSNATHLSWDDSNTAELMQHLEKQSDMQQVHQSPSMPQGVPIPCAPLPLADQWGPVLFMPMLAQVPHTPCMAQGQAPTRMAQCRDRRSSRHGRRPFAGTPLKQPILKRSSLTKETEEVWQQRIQKRRSIVSIVKATPEYQGCLAKRPTRRPTTPDPDDRSVSKRAWEGKVVTWRTGLRKGC